MKTEGGWEESKADRDWLTRVLRGLAQRAPSDPSHYFTHARTNVESDACARTTEQGCVESGSYRYGYYLPLIRMGGQPGCKGVGLRGCVCACVRAFARMRGYVAVFTQGEGREKERGGSRVLCAALSLTHYRGERDTAWLQTPLSLSAPRPDPRDFQDTRHTTHKPRTLCGVNQLDPSSLRARYRYNGAAQRNFLMTATALKCG